MAEVAAAAVGAALDVNTAGNPTEVAMAYLQDEVTFEYFYLNLQLLWKTKIFVCLCAPSFLYPVSIHNKRQLLSMNCNVTFSRLKCTLSC